MPIGQKIIQEYNSLNWNGLLREDLGDSGNLKVANSSLDRMKEIFDSLINNPVLGDIPNHERNFQVILSDFISFCNTEIKGNYTDTSQRSQIIGQIRKKEEEIINSLSPILNYVRFLDPSSQNKVKELEKTLRDADKLINDVKLKSNENKRIAEKQEVNKYGNAFGKMSVENKTSTTMNYILMLIFLAVTTVFACIFLWGVEIQISTNEEIGFWSNIWNSIISQNILLKLFILSIGGYLVSHFSRNLSAEKHLYYLNKHRQNALDSHQRIIDSVLETHQSEDDIETKNAILLQVTKTMFEIQDTGYLKTRGSPIPTTQVIENIISRK